MASIIMQYIDHTFNVLKMCGEKPKWEMEIKAEQRSRSV